ncbi:alpha/beta hydrolase family protein [Serinibacter salmoneus]|uniref:Alpha/beta hydrolase family protein n=2 Tax=Serinibacter salmoneus TaxID=556530 RepID=A0A2A9CZD4_9MICO|nr:alpha/beta hydrolase family protein [Serinibacter salmoneus]
MPLAGLGVVFLHGVRTSGTMWRDQVDLLRRQGAEVTAVDLPGHGTALAERFSLDACDQRIQEAVEALRVRCPRVAVVGLSLGGYLALHWAARTCCPPEILVVSSCTARTGGVLHRGFLALTRVLGDSGGRRLSARAARLAVGEQAAHDISAGGVSVGGQLAALRALLPLDPLGDLERVLMRGMDTTFLIGEFDHFRLHEREFRAVAAGRARWVLIRRAHHLVSLHRPRAYNRALLGELMRTQAESVTAAGTTRAPRRRSPRSSAR